MNNLKKQIRLAKTSGKKTRIRTVRGAVTVRRRWSVWRVITIVPRYAADLHYKSEGYDKV